MAKTRMVDTIFWEDHYTANLDPIEKLLFLYFLTNSSTSICGIYQITLRKVAAETGIDKDMVEKILVRFEQDAKIFYRDGWLGIKNFRKHQNQQSPQVKKGIEMAMKDVPKVMVDLVETEGMDTLSHLNLNYNLNLNSNLNTNTIPGRLEKPADEKFDPLGAEIIKAFVDTVDPKNKRYYANTTQRDACDFLLKEYGMEEVMKRIQALPKTNKLPFFPKIYTPHQLREHWNSLNDAVARYRRENIKKSEIAFT